MDLAALPPFTNEAYRDFSVPEHKNAQEAALAEVKSQLGKEYPLSIAGKIHTTTDKIRSVNPSNPSEIVGIHQKATPDLANQAIGAAVSFFPKWAATPAPDRARLLFRAVEILKLRKSEFNAWLVYEAGKAWNEAEAETAEAIDFCDYYA